MQAERCLKRLPHERKRKLAEAATFIQEKVHG